MSSGWASGFLGELGGVLGRVRYACGDRRRHTSLPGIAKVRPAPPDEPALEVPGPPNAPASLAALDIGAVPLPPAPADLSALDLELALGRRPRKSIESPPAAGDD